MPGQRRKKVGNRMRKKGITNSIRIRITFNVSMQCGFTVKRMHTYAYLFDLLLYSSNRCNVVTDEDSMNALF